MAYGGLVVEWSARRSRRIGLSVGALVGGGSSTLDTKIFGYPRYGFPRHHRWSPAEPGELQSFVVLAREGFFIFEPKASASLLLTRWLRLGAGVGYRVIGGAGEFEDRLRGVSATVSVQPGAF